MILPKQHSAINYIGMPVFFLVSTERKWFRVGGFDVSLITKHQPRKKSTYSVRQWDTSRRKSHREGWGGGLLPT